MKTTRQPGTKTIMASVIELLEARQLLSATKSADIPAQNLLTSNAPPQITLSTYLNDPSITGGTVIQMQTPEGNIPFQLTDSRTPLTVANFVTYINNGQYQPTLIQRSAPGFVLQGGGTKPDGSNNAPVQTLVSEAGISNTTGTISMALSNGPNSGTNQWFINLGNNTALNGTQDGGPFTVFGNVIDGGMAVINAIAALPTVDGSTENSNWHIPNGGGDVPVINYTGANPLPVGQTIPPADLVTDNIVVAPAAQAGPQYSATVADPSLLTASVSNGVLTLTPAPGVTSGTTNVTATVTDIGGETASSTFAVTLSSGSATAINVGAGAAKSLTYKDGNGTTGVVTLKGPGTATVNFSGSSLVPTLNKNNTETLTGASASIAGITTTGTTGASTLTITTHGGTKTINIGTLTTDGLKAISGKGVTLVGDLTSTGSIGNLAVAGASGGSINVASIGTLTSTGAFSDNLTLTSTSTSLTKFSAGSIAGGTWLVSGASKAITAGSASNWSADFAGSVAALTISKGDLNAAVTAVSLGAVRVKSSLSNSTFQLSGAGNDLANLTVGGAVSASTINAVGSIGVVSAGSLSNSQLYAGVGNLSINQPLPNFPADFLSAQSIAAVKLKTSKAGDSFFNSNIAAETMGTLSIGSAQTNNGGITTGVAAFTIKSFTATFPPKKFSLRNLSSSTDVAAAAAAKGVELGDFVLKLF